MRILRYTDSNFSDALSSLNRRAGASAETQAVVAEILAAVRARGDVALLEYTAKFGGPRFASAAQARVAPEEFHAAARAVDDRTQRALAEAHENVRTFALRSLRHDWQMKNRQGAEVGERFTPFPRVGIYVPGGSAPLVSTAIMTCTLAAAAGVPEIVVATPAGAAGEMSAALLCALDLAGATEVYKFGGAQAIAALALGTPTISPVAKIFGPGNAYVVEAKRQVFGPVAIDLLPGPSELLVLADATANPAWIVADLLAQAEHGADSIIGLVTDSEPLLIAVLDGLTTQAQTVRRHAEVGDALQNPAAFLALVRNLDDAVGIVNAFAPEHLSIVTAEPDAITARVHAAGAIFLGGWSAVAAGDFLAGPSHTLPTGGAGKSFAGLTVDQFQRRTSIVRLNEESLRHSLPIIQAFGEVEGLDAHGRSAAIRFDARTAY